MDHWTNYRDAVQKVSTTSADAAQVSALRAPGGNASSDYRYVDELQFL